MVGVTIVIAAASARTAAVSRRAAPHDWRRSTTIALGAILCVIGLPARGESSADVTAVKAAYLVKFAHYVSWPANAFATPTAPLMLCVVGHDPFGTVLDTAAHDERVDQHPIVLHRLPAIERNAGCHIAFVTGEAAVNGLAAIDGAAVLSVTDAEATRPHAVLSFVMRDGHVGFDVDDQLAAHNGLTISSRLLSIALSVSSREPRR